MTALPWRWFFIALIIFGGWKYWQRPSVSTAPDDPIQSYRDQGKVYQQGNCELEVLANFDIEARVLSKRFYDSDAEAELVPVDLALGWGAMANSSVLNKLSISQTNRFYYYRWESEPPLPPSEIASHSANMHLIPTNTDQEQQLRDISEGKVVHIVGHLVEARKPNGWRWRSSLTRDDTGAGACELILVESLQVR